MHGSIRDLISQWRRVGHRRFIIPRERENIVAGAAA
jgi:hypothetical protein